MKPITIKSDPQNPNRMEDADKKRMAASLAEFGDLGGIVINRRTGFLVGGHQRVSVLGDSLEIEDLKKPEPDGTVGRGWITKDGRRYTVRVVDWDKSKAHAALLAANRFGRMGHNDEATIENLLKEIEQSEISLATIGYDNESIKKECEENCGEEKEETLIAIKKWHCLISCDVSNAIDVLKSVEELQNKHGCEVRHVGN